MKTLAEQVQNFLEATGWKPARLAEEVNRFSKPGEKDVKRQNIDGVLAGIQKPRYMAALAKAMGTTVEVLDAGRFVGPENRQEMNDRPAEEQPEDAGTMNHLRRVPIVGTARMGDDGFYEEISSVPGAGDGHIDIATGDPNAYGLRVRGISMAPAIRDGWYVVVEPNGQLVHGEYVLIKLHDGKKMVKELLFTRNGSYEIMSVNGEERRTIYQDEIEGIQAVGAVVPPSKWKPD